MSLLQSISSFKAGPCNNADETSVSLDDSSGAYIKSACLVELLFGQADAKNYCERKGMKLFTIDSAETQTSLLDYLQPNFSSIEIYFRVDGIKDETDGKWYYYSNGKTLAFSGLDWLVSADTLSGRNTMVVTNTKIDWIMKVDGVDASSEFPFICEFSV